MTDFTTDFATLSDDQMYDLREFLRRIRDGTTAGFENSRIGDVNERMYRASSEANVFARETSEATLELGVTVQTTDDDPESLEEFGSAFDSLSETLVEALTDTFSASLSPSEFRHFNSTDDETTFGIRFHLPSETLV